MLNGYTRVDSEIDDGIFDTLIVITNDRTDCIEEIAYVYAGHEESMAKTLWNNIRSRMH